MAQQNTFDISSNIDHAEVVNAINQTLKEVHTRFDFKGSKSTIEVEGQEAIILSSEDEYRLKSLNDILQSKFVKRGVPLKGLTYGKVEPAAGSTVRQRISLQQGIPQEKAKEIVKFIKDAKLKVQVSIQGDLVRVAGKDRDTLQQVMAQLRDQDFGIDMQFGNYRSN
jgi:cyclic-di-GMP-binding protein